ncbi:MAG: DUF2934 domain-containing protein [Proteobacteria bacterium]|nr:DUF2934 domain-containing protein [Pseudomonadota bacterium]
MSNEPNTAETTAASLEERKRELAYQFWEEEGRPDGRAEAHWERACLVLMTLEEAGPKDPDWLLRKPAEAAAEPSPAGSEAEIEAGEDAAIAALRRRITGRNAA